MALDRAMTLLRGPFSESVAGSTTRIAQELDRVCSDRKFRPGPRGPLLAPLESLPGNADLALYLPVISTERLASVVERLRQARGNPYQTLDKEGILIIGSAARVDGGLLLSGGSYCDVVLQSHNNRMVITKRLVKNGEASGVDGFQRHKNEADFLLHMNRICDLFPQGRESVNNGCIYEFETDFFPAYSVGELVFQRMLTGSQLAELLCSLYGQLRSTLYARQPVHTFWPDRDRNYLDKISRRLATICSATEGSETRLVQFLQAPHVRVNGRRCASLATILHTIASDPMWSPIIRPETRHACHGDLILEDILLSQGGRQELKLIDPNPYNSNGLMDLAKTMLSLWIGYEFVYFDFFDINTEVSAGGEVRVDVKLHSDDYGDVYAVAAERFMEYARTELGDFLGISRRSFDRLVYMSAALTALAIPSFHLIRHGRPDRALAFAALGLLHASHALAGGVQPATGY
jgi:hypothetical protein